MKAITIFGAIAVAVLFFFAVIFALASSSDQFRKQLNQGLITSGLLFIIGLAVIVGIYYVTRKPKTVIQRLRFQAK